MPSRKVKIDTGYLVFLHDQLAINQARMKEIFGPSGSEMILNSSSDKLMQAVGKEFPFHPLDGLVSTMKEWGMKVMKEEKDGRVDVSIECPYAEAVHPKLSSDSPVCPLSEYTLGALRMENKAAALETNKLLPGGAHFRFRVSDTE